MKAGSAAQKALVAYALGYPEAWEDNPWGERVAKVGKKVFVFLGVASARELSLSVKLPSSREVALSLPFATPTGYGLGKSGWVTARFVGGEAVPREMLEAWIDESYCAVAPKKLMALRELGAEPARRKPKAARPTSPRAAAHAVVKPAPKRKPPR